jgi:hypothetical protein
MKNRVFVWLLAAAVLGAASAVPAAAQDPGVRVGVSVDPDQFYFGGHVESGPIYEELRFRPNIEVGFGDNITLVALNGEFIWPFELENNNNIVYIGMGPAINIYSFDIGMTNDTEVEPGLNFLVGFEFGPGYFAELKVGAIDSPDVKFGFGYTWRV